MRAEETSVLVRGAGPVGCVAALALHQAGVPVALVGKEGAMAALRPSFRPLVLSYASRLILERLGIWSALSTSAIRTIHVSQAGHFGRTVFGAQDAGVPDLGYVLEYAALLRALQAAAQALMGEASARCTVHAEGSALDAAEKRYSQDALVAAVRFSQPAGATAYERFTSEGPLALLPQGERYALVWSLRPERARELSAAPEAEFLGALAALAPARAGRPLAAEARTIHPLSLRFRRTTVEANEIYIGNAAQTLHPVAGQGLNLGLRDAWELAQIMRGAQDPADARVLQRFAASRRLDATAAIRVTDFLARAFLKSNVLSGIALTALDVLPAPRRFFARRMIYGTAALP
jgi:2-octaprenyl-6-methoxyphenol hydroxylase